MPLKCNIAPGYFILRAFPCCVCVIFSLFAGNSYLYCQTLSDVHNDSYIGIGISKDIDKARISAFNNLIQQIQVFISSTSVRTINEANTSLQDTLSVQSVTRSSLMLSDVEEGISKLSDGSFRVMKSVSRESVKKLFDERRARILYYIESAQKEISVEAPNVVNLGSALKQYSWAWLLATIHPETIQCSFNGSSSVVTDAVPKEIENIIHGISFTPVKQVDDEIVTWKYRVEFNKHPVSHLYFEYMDGIGQSVGEVLDGETQLSFFFRGKQQSQREFLIEINYLYEDEMDVLLSFADSIQRGRVLSSSVIGILPGNLSDDEQQRASSLPGEYSLPKILEKLVSKRENIEEILAELNTLIKEKKIILGDSNEFESHEGLYIAVVSKDGLDAMVRYSNQKYFDMLSHTEVEIQQYAGKKMTWIEVLK